MFKWEIFEMLENKICSFTNLWDLGNFSTIFIASLGSSVCTHSSYKFSDMSGWYNSRYHNFNKLAGVWASEEKK